MRYFRIILWFTRRLKDYGTNSFSYLIKVITMKCDLIDLRLFLNIIEEGSITAGAPRTNLALASASERL